MNPQSRQRAFVVAAVGALVITYVVLARFVPGSKDSTVGWIVGETIAAKRPVVAAA